MRTISAACLLTLAFLACGPSAPPPNTAALPAGHGFFCATEVSPGMQPCAREEQKCVQYATVMAADKSQVSCKKLPTAWCLTYKEDGQLIPTCATRPDDCNKFGDYLRKKGKATEISSCDLL